MQLQPRTDVVKVAPDVLYIAVIDSLRQQFYPKMRQAGRDRKISDRHRKGYYCPMCEKEQATQAPTVLSISHMSHKN